MVVTRSATGSVVALWKLTGEVSVMPYAIVTSAMCMRAITRCMTSAGQGEPAMMPVRRVPRP